MPARGDISPMAADSNGNRKQSHCEIEKRRRDKMNHYIMELASMIPSFNADHPKFDKLTVLRMAVQQVKSLRSSLCSFSSFHLRPSFLSSGNLLKNLILQMASQEAQDILFMVVSCDRGKVLFVSQSSRDILNHDQKELVGQCLFDFLHKDDVSKIKEQITYFNLMPKEMLVDSKTLQPIRQGQRKSHSMLHQQDSTPQPGARRSFFCRMRTGRNHPLSLVPANNQSENWTAPAPPPPAPLSRAQQAVSASQQQTEKVATNPLESNESTWGRLTSGGHSKKQRRYIVMHCTGYLKTITLRNDEYDDDQSDSNDSDSSLEEDYNDNFRTINCLVAVCRRSPMYRDLGPDRPLTFTCRYSMEGKFVFVDQRTTVALGYTPQQLLGTSHYAYCHKDSVNTFKECHRQCILKSEPVSSDIYQFKRANGQHLWLQTSLKSFRNPWTKFIDYIVANHTTAGDAETRYNVDCVPTKFNQDISSEDPQLPSPGSTSSLSSPSMDSKKSSSPSSSSIGSSYSMESYASGGNIQALLNHIDRQKSGGNSFSKASLNLPRRRNNSSRIIRSYGSGSSTKRSTDDSGHYSDPQSCSSLSSQNSALSSEFVHNLQAPSGQTFSYSQPSSELTNIQSVKAQQVSGTNSSLNLTLPLGDPSQANAVGANSGSAGTIYSAQKQSTVDLGNLAITNQVVIVQQHQPQSSHQLQPPQSQQSQQQSQPQQQIQPQQAQQYSCQQCQQCLTHKCTINQQLPSITSQTDLNSINLSSLAVDGDLNEDELLEYLAGFDQEVPLDQLLCDEESGLTTSSCRCTI